jgi:hypothetical protein
MTLRILSLGAGVQSTTMALMAAHGEIPMPDYGVFADTKAEPAAVYEHLRWISGGNVLPFPVVVVSAGDLREGLRTPGRFVSVPFFGRKPDGKPMMARRQCTEEFKLKPIRRFVREKLGKRPRPGACVMMIGISQDEAIRAKPSRVKYIVNEYPLLEKGMKRWDCLQWLRRHEYPVPPRSACCECPFRSDAEWRRLQRDDPSGFAEAVKTDAGLRRNDGGAVGRFLSELYLHPSLQPLGEVDFRNAEERGQGVLWQDFGNECEGMCGL